MTAFKLALSVVFLARLAQANNVDKCVYLANFDVASALNSALAISSIPGGNGLISQCVCIGGIGGASMTLLSSCAHRSRCIPAFINQNPAATMAVQQSGMSTVVAALAGIV
jgi:hypothetical protein